MSLMKFQSVPIQKPGHFFKGTDIGPALLKILMGIQAEWALLDTDMAEILQRNPSTFATWKKQGSVTISEDRPTPNDQIIFAFINIYDLISSLIYRKEQRGEWIRQPNEALAGQSPLEIMKSGSENLYKFKEFMTRLHNP